MTDDLDIEPGYHEETGATVALVDQQRANMIRLLRTADALSVTVYHDHHESTHWAIYLRGDNAGSMVFFIHAAVKCVRDAAAALDVDPATVCRLVLAAIEDGFGA